MAYWIIIRTLIVLPSLDSWVHPSIIVQSCMFPSSIHHYIIWSDKWYFLVHIIVEINPLEISMICCWAYQPPPHPLLGLLMNSCFRAHLHRSFLRISQCHLVKLCCTFSSQASWCLRYPDTNRIWISVRYDGWDIFPRVITLVYLWPGKMMSWLAHLAGGPIVIASFLARLTILPWGNCQNYSISCSWLILWVSKSDLAWRPCQCYLEACLWYSEFQQEHLKPMLNVSY